MKTRTRFIRSIIKTAQDCDTVLPYARSARLRATAPDDDSPLLAQTA